MNRKMITRLWFRLLKKWLSWIILSLKLYRNFLWTFLSCGRTRWCVEVFTWPVKITGLDFSAQGCGCQSWKEPAGLWGVSGSFRIPQNLLDPLDLWSKVNPTAFWEPEGLEMPVACCSRDPRWFLNVDLSKSVTIPRAITTKFKK